VDLVRFLAQIVLEKDMPTRPLRAIPSVHSWEPSAEKLENVAELAQILVFAQKSVKPFAEEESLLAATLALSSLSRSPGGT
jgi:hypothetical protein